MSDVAGLGGAYWLVVFEVYVDDGVVLFCCEDGLEVPGCDVVGVEVPVGEWRDGTAVLWRDGWWWCRRICWSDVGEGFEVVVELVGHWELYWGCPDG